MKDFNTRIIVPEIIDDFELNSSELALNLSEIEWINKYLGGIQASVRPILRHVQHHSPATIADIGCGSGDILKYIHTTCKGSAYAPALIGVDANAFILETVRKKHFDNPKDVRLVHADILQDPASIPPASIYMLNLFLHHFEEKQVTGILKNLEVHQPELIVINDLERSRLAYVLFLGLCRLIGASAITRNDGALSIKKGFKKKELLHIASFLPGYSCKIEWKWAFRWQVELKRITKN